MSNSTKDLAPKSKIVRLFEALWFLGILVWAAALGILWWRIREATDHSIMIGLCHQMELAAIAGGIWCTFGDRMLKRLA
jgi:hypothetical protein